MKGELAHGHPENPLTGEAEDTDVGFPGPEHHIAERSVPMKFAMSILAVLAVLGGVVGVPAATDTLEHFLEPSFEDSHYIHDHPGEGAEWLGLGAGGLVGVLGIALAYHVYMRRRWLRLVIRERFDSVHTFLVNKWYFDELFDAAFVRPMRAFGQFGARVVENTFVQGAFVGGTTAAVRAGTSFARSIQGGYIRGYALFLLMGIAGLALYFLIAAA